MTLLVVTEVYVVDKITKSSTVFGMEVIIGTHTNMAADGTIKYTDNGVLFETLGYNKGNYISGLYYTFKTPGTHIICAEAV